MRIAVENFGGSTFAAGLFSVGLGVDSLGCEGVFRGLS
jgi:hypothetical protein